MYRGTDSDALRSLVGGCSAALIPLRVEQQQVRLRLEVCMKIKAVLKDLTKQAAHAVGSNAVNVPTTAAAEVTSSSVHGHTAERRVMAMIARPLCC